MLHTPRTWNWSAALSTDGSRPLWGQVYAKGSQSEEAIASSGGVGGKIVFRALPNLQFSLGVDTTRESDRQRYIALIPVGGTPGWFVSDLRAQSRSLALRAEWFFRPEFSVQYYGNPFGSTVRYSSFRRVEAPDAATYAERFGPTLPTTFSGGQYTFDENADGRVDYQLADPDGNVGSFHSNLVFKWEYRRGSMVYLVWSQQRNGADPAKTEDAWSALGGLRRLRPDNQFLVKVTYWFSS